MLSFCTEWRKSQNHLLRISAIRNRIFPTKKNTIDGYYIVTLISSTKMSLMPFKIPSRNKFDISLQVFWLRLLGFNFVIYPTHGTSYFFSFYCVARQMKHLLMKQKNKLPQKTWRSATVSCSITAHAGHARRIRSQPPISSWEDGRCQLECLYLWHTLHTLMTADLLTLLTLRLHVVLCCLSVRNETLRWARDRCPLRLIS